MARTVNVWLPSTSGDAGVNGLVQDTGVAASIAQVNVAASVAVKVKVGVLSPVVPVGPPVIVGVGATVSTVNDRVAGVLSVIPFVFARTENVCAP